MASTSSSLQRRNLSTKSTQSNGAQEKYENSFSASHHDHDGEHDHGADSLLKAMQGGGDPGSRITLVGLYANVGLTISKGVAGWALNSASLIADAAHSLSDLIGDFVTLFCWKWSRRPPSQTYPYGFGKFESLGTATVSLLLMGGAVGTGFHSYYLLLEALEPSIASMPPGVAQDVLATLSSSNLTESLAQVHSHEHPLDPNAAWFALLGIVSKEWLYRITKRVATQERSSVLLANALHHRSDAYTSIVAFFAILGTWWAPWLPLDPIGGLLVSLVILQQAISLLRPAVRELMDAGVSPKTLSGLYKALTPLTSDSSQDTSSQLLKVSDLRAKKSGTKMVVDLTAHLSAHSTLQEATDIEDLIKSKLINHREEISEVKVKFVVVKTNNGHAH